jgi:hypothetical protein
MALAGRKPDGHCAKNGGHVFKLVKKKSAGGCGDDTQFILSPHPPSAQFSLGNANLAHHMNVASDFFKNNFRFNIASFFCRTSLHSTGTI